MGNSEIRLVPASGGSARSVSAIWNRELKTPSPAQTRRLLGARLQPGTSESVETSWKLLGDFLETYRHSSAARHNK